MFYNYNVLTTWQRRYPFLCSLGSVLKFLLHDCIRLLKAPFFHILFHVQFAQVPLPYQSTPFIWLKFMSFTYYIYLISFYCRMISCYIIATPLQKLTSLSVGTASAFIAPLTCRNKGLRTRPVPTGVFVSFFR